MSEEAPSENEVTTLLNSLHTRFEQENEKRHGGYADQLVEQHGGMTRGVR